jgi:hypothetical protein
MAAAGTVDLGLKLAFDRQFPYSPNSTGAFWGGGRSFPSGHSATSFAWAAATAHRTHNKWAKNCGVWIGVWSRALSLSRQKTLSFGHSDGGHYRICNRHIPWRALTREDRSRMDVWFTASARSVRWKLPSRNSSLVVSRNQP